MPPIGDDVLHACVQRIDNQQQNTGGHDQRPVLPWQKVINEAVHSNGKRQLKQAGADGAEEVQQKQLAVRSVIREKTS
ncbi:hypothetical protein D3C73_1493630 [compost metagenome]